MKNTNKKQATHAVKKHKKEVKRQSIRGINAWFSRIITKGKPEESKKASEELANRKKRIAEKHNTKRPVKAVKK